MTTNTGQVGASSQASIAMIAARAWYFIRHYVEMCLAMCIGGIPLIALSFWGAARLGFPDLITRSPELSVLVIGLILAVPMTAWMRFRHHDWRSTLEMAASSIVLAVLLVAASALGVLARTAVREWMTTLACPAMLVPMFIRLDHYTASHASHQHHAQDAATDADPHAHHHHPA